MTQGSALAFALSATVALLLANRALRSMRQPRTTKAWMAGAWVVLIILAAGIAQWWQA